MVEALVGAIAATLMVQEPVPQAGPPAPTPEATQQGVLAFTPDFFAEARPNTALDMVNRLPGFDLSDGDGSRGFEGAVGNVLINGARPASKSDTGSNVLNRTPASQVERIDLIRGGAPGIDMQGYSVVANVILKRETSVQQVMTSESRIFDGGRDYYGGTYQYSARAGDRSWGVTLADGLAADDSQGPGRVLRISGSGSVLRDEQIVAAEAGGGAQAARVTYAGPLWGGRIDATSRLGVGDYESLNVQESAAVRRASGSSNDSGNGELGLTWTRPLTEALKLEARLIHQFNTAEGASYSQVRSGGVDGPRQVFSFDSFASETIARGLLRNERSASLTFEGGAELAYNLLDTEQAFTIGGTAVPLPSDTVKVDEIRGELFGKSTWRPSAVFSLEAGLRLERSTIRQTGAGTGDTEKSLVFAKPRLLATWTPRPADQFRLRLEREVGQLDFGDFAASADLENENVFGGNIDLEPEQRWVAEFIYERRFWGEGVASITLRRDEISDALDRIPLTPPLSARGNIGDGWLNLMALSLTLPMDKLGVAGARLTVNGIWQDSEVTDPTTGEKRPISRIWPFDANAHLVQDINSLNLQWGISWLSGYDEANFDPDERTDVYLRNYVYGFVEWKPTRTLSLRAQVNIWDDFVITRTAYADRISRAAAYVETRDVDPRTFLTFKVRKTF